MDVSIELVFFFVFFVPMGIMVTLNLLLHRALPDVAAPWVRVSGCVEGQEPEPPSEEPLPQRAAEPVSNDEEALEAA